jgi:hypothetical protein
MRDGSQHGVVAGKLWWRGRRSTAPQGLGGARRGRAGPQGVPRARRSLTPRHARRATAWCRAWVKGGNKEARPGCEVSWCTGPRPKHAGPASRPARPANNHVKNWRVPVMDVKYLQCGTGDLDRCRPVGWHRPGQMCDGRRLGIACVKLWRPPKIPAGQGRQRAKARGVVMGRKPKLTSHQRREAIARREAGEILTDIARSYNVSHSTISRLS